MSAQREHDLVLLGATGFAGRLAAAHLAQQAPPGLRIALAGRSADRLRDTRTALGPAAARWPIVTADGTRAASMDALARSARVVATAAGPYRAHGLLLAEACAVHGTHYADLAGEVLFMRETARRLHAVAERSGARIVHACGFDSVPSDLGMLLVHEAARERGAGDLERATLVVRVARGGVSGGTIASMRTHVDEVRRDPALGRIVRDPYALSPDRSAEPDLGPQRDLLGLERDEDLGMWLAPFVMAPVNTRVVRRSNALLGWAYGRRLRYREVVGVRAAGPLAPLRAGAIVAGLGALQVGLGFGPARALLDRVLPSPGDGPDEETRRNGLFRIEIHARTSSGARLVARVGAQGDPGYAATAVMFGQSALSLACDGERLPDRAGVLTPATAMGDALLARLRAAGHTYEIDV